MTHARKHEQRGRDISEATRRAIVDAISTVGPDATFAAVRREADRRCVSAGTPTASNGTIHAMLMAARSGARDRGGEPALIVGRVWMHMPVTTGHLTVTAPQMVLAVSVPERAIVAHRLVIDDTLEVAVAAVTREVLDLVPDRTILADRKLAATVLATPGAVNRGARDAGKTALLTSWLGSRIGKLSIRHRELAVGATPGPGPVTAADARSRLRREIELHNARADGRDVPTA